MRSMFAWWMPAMILGLGLAWPSGVLAQRLSVDPVSISLPGAQRSAVLHLSNDGDKPITVQLRAFAWSQGVSGEDRLAGTDNLVIGPPFVTLAPGGAQVVRLLLRVPAMVETPYRIVIDQIPVEQTTSSLNLRLTLSLPLFAGEPTRLQRAARWRLGRTPAGTRELVVVNEGSTHMRVDGLQLGQGNAAPRSLAGNGSRYVLAGAERHWPIPGDLRLDPAAPLTIMVRDGGVEQTTVLPPAGH